MDVYVIKKFIVLNRYGGAYFQLIGLFGTPSNYFRVTTVGIRNFHDRFVYPLNIKYTAKFPRAEAVFGSPTTVHYVSGL